MTATENECIGEILNENEKLRKSHDEAMEMLSESLEQLENLRAILESSERTTSDNEKLIKMLKKKIYSFMKCQAEIEELNEKIGNIEKKENLTQPIEESADIYRKIL